MRARRGFDPRAAAIHNVDHNRIFGLCRSIVKDLIAFMTLIDETIAITASNEVSVSLANAIVKC
jgi:hypothetical protein